jgi:hypothetical protein
MDEAGQGVVLSLSRNAGSLLRASLCDRPTHSSATQRIGRGCSATAESWRVGGADPGSPIMGIRLTVWM